MNNNGFEIERKYMIAMPEEAFLAKTQMSEITQTYIQSEKGSSERVRKRVTDGVAVYTYNKKIKLSNMKRIEEEREISPEEYESLLLRKDPERIVIEKKRYCFDFAGMLWELDVFPFWKDKAFLEIELESESQQVEFPSFLTLIRELTDDKRYTNAALAKHIPED